MKAIVTLIIAISSLMAQASSANIRFGQIQSSCEEGIIKVSIQASNTLGRTIKSNNWSGKFSFNADLIDYPSVSKSNNKGDFQVFQNEDKLSFNFNSKQAVELPRNGEWVTLGVIEFEIQSYFDATGVSFKWLHDFNAPAVTAKNVSGRGSIAVGSYGDANPKIKDVCPPFGALIEDVKIEETADGKVTLTWETSVETTNKGFEIQYVKVKGNDLERNFKRLTFVESKGRGAVYTFTIDNLSDGKHLFRIRQIDASGDFEYTDAVSLEILPTLLPQTQDNLDMALGL